MKSFRVLIPKADVRGSLREEAHVRSSYTSRVRVCSSLPKFGQIFSANDLPLDPGLSNDAQSDDSP